MTFRAAETSRRTVLGLAVLAGTSACSLRLENDTPLPGPKATAAPDTTPLRQVRDQLVAAMTAASRETVHVTEAARAQTLHRQHLARLDATLKGLDATHLPSAGATADPTSPTPSATSTAAAASSSHSHGSTSASPAASAHASASSPASSTVPASTSWTQADSRWASQPLAASIQHVSTHSRPLALAIAARSIAGLPAGMDPAWMPDMTVHAGAELLTPLEEAIEALEWMAATTPVKDRAPLAALLHQLYAVRSVADSTDASAAGRAHPTPERYASKDAAKSVVGKAGEAMASACASAATTTKDASAVNGLTFAWSRAIATQQWAGLQPGAFPGLVT